MSDAETKIDLDAARLENARLRELGTHFAESVDRLRLAAQRYDGCWGGDKFGQAFATGYVPNSKTTLENVTTFGKNVGGTAEQIEQALTEFEKVDQGNANNL
ncbi:hypothetical protein [Amycolatopsis sp. NPDC059657]|uniref:hypothetical protein n=1 Tax=Amycolatopsis sp. NPDC059657 TaxID=3346899 RepID=UPI00366FF80C